MTFLGQEWLPYVLNFFVLILSVFLILLVLIQRGKGGGLSGALGGVGGSSPFGSRAGDMFTRITIISSVIWLLLIMIQVVSVQEVINVKMRGGGQRSTLSTQG